ncbi:MAG: PQQ-binding-like beta-propeller repeat protein [Acidobacteria bacterium]|nr:PQQ-binding-like beta-propeller repeat protein [Acidobacteriota bacterium]
MPLRLTSWVLSLTALAASAQAPAPMTALSPSWQAQWLLRLRAGQGGDPGKPTQPWQVSTGQVEIPPAFDGTHLVVVQASPKKVQALDPATGKVIWEVPFTGLLDGPPQLAENRVIFTLEGGRIGVLDATTGALRNLLTLPAWKPAKGSLAPAKPRLLFPAASGNTLVAGWSTASQDMRPELGLFAFDLTTGAMRWSVALPGASELHPLILGDRVLVGGSGQVMTFDLPTGRMLWGLKTPKRGTFESCQLIEDRLFLRTAQEIVAIDPVFGRILWSQEAPGSSLLLGSGDRLVYTTTRGAFNPSEWVVAFNARTGEKAWEWEAEATRLPWIQGGRVILNAKEELLGLDLATGAPLWRRDLGGALLLPLQVQGDTVLAVHRAKGGSRLVAIRTADGSESGATQLRERIGAGLILGGPQGILLPLLEGGIAAIP